MQTVVRGKSGHGKFGGTVRKIFLKKFNMKSEKNNHHNINKMKKKERYNKKNLRKRLAAIMTIYMDGIGEKKKKRFEKYLDSKLKDIVDYYMVLLKKKERKNRVLPPAGSELEILSPSIDKMKSSALIPIEEMQDTANEDLLEENASPVFSEAVEKDIEYNTDLNGTEPGKFENAQTGKEEKPSFGISAEVAV